MAGVTHVHRRVRGNLGSPGDIRGTSAGFLGRWILDLTAGIPMLDILYERYFKDVSRAFDEFQVILVRCIKYTTYGQSTQRAHWLLMCTSVMGCCCCCCSQINSHNQVRGHRTGSSHSGAEEFPREKTQTNQRWYTHISQLTQFMPPPENI